MSHADVMSLLLTRAHYYVYYYHHHHYYALSLSYYVLSFSTNPLLFYLCLSFSNLQYGIWPWKKQRKRVNYHGKCNIHLL